MMNNILAVVMCVATILSTSTEYFNTTPNTEVTIVVAGDNLIHSQVIKSGLQEDGSYDFTDMYSEISDYIQQFDIRVINQETPLVKDASLYSGYPQFGSPLAIGEAVIDAGFNVVTHATNHTADKGSVGIVDSHEFWSHNKIPDLGIYPKEQEEQLWVIEEKGIRIGMLNYTYGLNGLTVPNFCEYNVGDLNNKEQVQKDLKSAERNSDIQIVFVHWGTEYVYEPTKYQKDMAQFLADCGADIIVGTHPHVVEPLSYVYSETGQMVPVYYSLGNFLSGQSEVPRMLGALAEITIVKDANGVHVSSTDVTPVVTHIETYSGYFKTYLLEDYTEELASVHRLRRVLGNQMSLQNLWDLWNDVMCVEKENNYAVNME